jgi:hypothetical protein
LKVCGINDVREIEMDTAEPLVPEPSSFKVRIVIEKLERHKSLDTDQIPTLSTISTTSSLNNVNLYQPHFKFQPAKPARL